MKPDYFDKVIKILKELKNDFPEIEISKHYSLATSDHGDFITDKELFEALVRHRGELNINNLTIVDINKLKEETDELFREIDPEDEDSQEEEWEEEYK